MIITYDDSYLLNFHLSMSLSAEMVKTTRRGTAVVVLLVSSNISSMTTAVRQQQYDISSMTSAV